VSYNSILDLYFVKPVTLDLAIVNATRACRPNFRRIRVPVALIVPLMCRMHAIETTRHGNDAVRLRRGFDWQLLQSWIIAKRSSHRRCSSTVLLLIPRSSTSLTTEVRVGTIP